MKKKFISEPEQILSTLTTPQGLQKQKNAKDHNPAVHFMTRSKQYPSYFHQQGLLKQTNEKKYNPEVHFRPGASSIHPNHTTGFIKAKCKRSQSCTSYQTQSIYYFHQQGSQNQTNVEKHNPAFHFRPKAYTIHPLNKDTNSAVKTIQPVCPLHCTYIKKK